jgi:hypothetical protein
MGVNSLAPIGPRGAGHRSRDTTGDPTTNKNHSGGMRSKKGGSRIAKLHYPLTQSRNAFRLNNPSVKTGGAREEREAEGDAGCE